MVVIDNKKNKEVLFKSNDLIQKIWHALGIREQQIFALLVKEIQPYDIEFKMQKFTFAQIAKELGWTDGGNTRVRLMTALKNMRKTCFWHRSLNNVNRLELCSALGDASIDVKEKTVDMILDKKLEPYLLGLRKKGSFTAVQFNYVVKADSRFTMPLYEYLRSKGFRRHTWQIIITVTELRGLLNAKPTQDWRDFRKYALNIAVEEINRITDITVKYESNKIGKEIDSVTFYCNRKRNSQDKEEFDEQVNKESFENIYDDEREDLCSDLPDSYYDEYIAFEGFDDDNMEIEEFDD